MLVRAVGAMCLAVAVWSVLVLPARSRGTARRCNRRRRCSGRSADGQPRCS